MNERLECCCKCDDPTGKAGKGGDSLFLDNGEGPFCEDCWEDVHCHVRGEG